MSPILKVKGPLTSILRGVHSFNSTIPSTWSEIVDEVIRTWMNGKNKKGLVKKESVSQSLPCNRIHTMSQCI